MSKNPPTSAGVPETQVPSLGQADPLEEEMATHSSVHDWKIPWTEELASYSPWGHKESDTTNHTHKEDDHHHHFLWNMYRERDREMQRYGERQRYLIYGHGALKSLLSTRLEEMQVMTFTWPLTDTTVLSTGKLSLSSRREQFTFPGISGIPLPLKLLLLKNHISLEQRSSGCGMDVPSTWNCPKSMQAWMGKQVQFLQPARIHFPKAPLLKYPKAWDALGSPFSPSPGKILSLEKGKPYSHQPSPFYSASVQDKRLLNTN